MQTAPASILGLLFAAISAAPLAAQQNSTPADRTMVARLSLPDGSLDGVTSSDQLVQALRDHLTIELADPLDETLQADLHAWAGQVNSSQPGFLVQSSPLGVRYSLFFYHIKYMYIIQWIYAYK